MGGENKHTNTFGFKGTCGQVCCPDGMETLREDLIEMPNSGKCLLKTYGTQIYEPTRSRLQCRGSGRGGR